MSDHTELLREHIRTLESRVAIQAELVAALRLVSEQPGFEPDEPYGVAVLAALAKVAP